MGRIWSTVHCQLPGGQIAIIHYINTQSGCHGGIQELIVLIMIKYKRIPGDVQVVLASIGVTLQGIAFYKKVEMVQSTIYMYL